MKIVNQTIKCPYCNNEINTLVTMSQFIPFTSLDLKLPNELRLKTDHCKNCNYTFVNGNVKYDSVKEMFIKSPEYKKIWEDNLLDTIEKEHLSLLIISESKMDVPLIYIDLAWHNENKDDYEKAKEYRRKYLEVAREVIDENERDNNEDINLYNERILNLLLQMLDSYRQLEDVDNANKIIDEVETFLNKEENACLKEDVILNIINFEKELLSNNDFKEHFTNEISE